MLRDIPKIYGMLFGVAVILSLLVVWYINTFQRDGNTLQLNDAILSNAVAEVDQTSRLYEGALLLNDTFELSVFHRLEEIYQEGDSVQFDYLFDTEDDRFEGVEAGTISSPTYIIGGKEEDKPQKENVTYMTGRPIEVVRVKVHKNGDKVGTWTHTSTVTVDAVSRN